MSLYAVWEPNNYQFVFEGEDCENIKSINAKYGESINLPAPISEHATFIGWSFGALDTEAEYKAGDNLLVSNAADKQQVLNTDNAVITLYAIWDQLPAIDAEDTFYAIKDIEKGMKKTSCRYIIEADRGKAIKMALELCKNDDLVLILGKGHERYQIIKDVKVPFDDREVVLENINMKGIKHVFVK